MWLVTFKRIKRKKTKFFQSQIKDFFQAVQQCQFRQVWMAVCFCSGWFGENNLDYFVLCCLLCQISITFILWENMRSMCAEFRRAANLTMSLLIKREVDNYADDTNCSWYRVWSGVFIALDLRALHVLLLTDFSAWEVTDGVKRFLCSRSMGATAVNRINLRGERSFCQKPFYLLVTCFNFSKFLVSNAAQLATVANRTLPGRPQVLIVIYPHFIIFQLEQTSHLVIRFQFKTWD